MHMARMTQLAAMARVLLGGRPAQTTITLYGSGHRSEDWLVWSDQAGVNLTINRSDHKTPASPAVEVTARGAGGQTITICGTAIGGMYIIELLKQVDGTARRLVYLTEKAADGADSAASLQAQMASVTAALFGVAIPQNITMEGEAHAQSVIG